MKHCINNNLTIKMEYRSKRDCLIWLLIVMPFLFGTLNEFLGLPWAVRYLMDAAWCLLLIYQFLQRRNRITWLGLWVGLFLIYTLLIYLIQFQSPLYYLWGVRNNFRFYAAFFAFAAFLKAKDVKEYLDLLDKLFWLDILVSVYQFFALGLEGDYLGGLFGAELGSNGYTNMFFLIIVSKSIVFYLEKKEKLRGCFGKCAAALVVAAMAELKFFFIEFVLVIALAVLFTNFTWRKLTVILGGCAGAVVCVALLVSLFPSYAGWFTLSSIWESAASTRGYTSSGDLNRLNAISRINELWLGDAGSRLFGLGLGNCDTSSFSFLNTPFFQHNEDMHYTWISYAMMYLETGWIGLFFYWGFFVLVYYRLSRLEKYAEEKVVSYCRIARIMAVLCIVISVYNSTLRTEVAYMAYFVMAIPFVGQNRRMVKHTA